MSNPYDEALDELRGAYFDVPAGFVTDKDLAESMPRLLKATQKVLELTNRMCPVCTEYHFDSQDAAHSDLAAILRELGLGDYARPISSHAVVREEVLPAIRRLKPLDADAA